MFTVSYRASMWKRSWERGIVAALFMATFAWGGAIRATAESADVEGAVRVIETGAGSDLEAAVASAQPGDVLELGDGVWRDQRLTLAGQGSRDEPIRIRPATPGGVRFAGMSSLVLRGNDLLLEGVHFKDGALDGGAVVFLQGQRMRLNGVVIEDYNPGDHDIAYNWVALRGQNHEVEWCTFRGKSHAGPTLEIFRSGMSPDHHRIRNNHFLDRRAADGDGWETIRIGTSQAAYSNSYTVVERNLFAGCEGEELISNRSGGNAFRNNTFRRNEGALTLRKGQANLVEGNFFLGEPGEETGGIWLVGRGQVVVNNYLEGAGTWTQAAISLGAGIPGAPLGRFEAPDGVIVAFNTIINAPGLSLELAEGLGSRGRTLAPTRVAIANNILLSELAPDDDFVRGEAGSGAVFEGNIHYGREVPDYFLDGGRAVDPGLTRAADGLMRPGRTSPGVAAAVGEYRMVVQDMDGQRRSAMKDVGADEVSDAPVRNAPLTAADVGASWYRTVLDDTEKGS